jgi:hypothetical protein
MSPHWQSSTRGIAKNWKIENFKDPAKSSATCWNILSKYGDFKIKKVLEM